MSGCQSSRENITKQTSICAALADISTCVALGQTSWKSKQTDAGQFELVALNAHRDTHTAADAKRGKSLLGVATLHFEQQRVQDART